MEKFTELKIEELTPGSGAAVEKGDTVSVHYRGALRNGTVFDSSYERGEPIEFPVGIGMVIQGWDRGLIGMKEGGRYRLSIPSDLGYGARGAGSAIPPDADLVFEVEIVSVKKPAPKLYNELEVIELAPGEGRAVASGDTVRVHYKGMLTDGTVFDSSYERNDPIEIQVGVGMVIPGWDQGLLGLQTGGRYRLNVPSELGYGPYGAGGVIPPHADLVFEVEIVEIH